MTYNSVVRGRRRKYSSKPIIAGVLLIILGVLSLMIAIPIGILAAVSIDIDEDDIKDWDLYSNQRVSVLGIVTDNTGMGIEGAQVTVVGKNVQTYTNEKGEFVIFNLEVGPAKIRIEAEGFVTQQFEKILNDNDNINHTEFEDKKNLYGWDDLDADDDYVIEWGNKDFDAENNFYLVRMNPGSGEDVTGLPDAKKIRSTISPAPTICFGVVALASILTLGGGIAAVTRRSYPLALIGCIAGLFTPVFLINILFSLIAFIILLLSRNEFHPVKRIKTYVRQKERTVRFKSKKQSKKQ